MTKLSITLLIGIIAGIIDIIPMLIMKLDRYANLSAFFHWVITAFFISYIQVPLSPWLKGFIVAELSIIPVLIIVSKDDRKSILPMVTMSAILGVLVGIATARFAI